MAVEQLKQYRLAMTSFSDKGQRQRNEDRILFSQLDTGVYLLGVVDGMGGYEDGELAADIAKESILEYLSLNIEFIDEKMVVDSFVKAHNTISSTLNQSGATVAVVLIKHNKVHIFWTGDVKVLLKSGDIEFVSKDHTLLNLIRESGLTVKTDEITRLKNTVVKSLGGKSNSYVPEYISFDLFDGFYGFICSDGVHQLFSTSELFQTLSHPNTQSSLESIINCCKEKAVDNFSGIFFCEDSDIRL